MNKKLNKKLKAKIFEKFGTQADFAEAIGENDTIVSKVVRGRRDISDKKQKKWSKALNCKVEDIFS